MSPSDPMQHFRGRIAKYLTEDETRPTMGPEGPNTDLPARRLTDEWARDTSYSLDGALKGLITLRREKEELASNIADTLRVERTLVLNKVNTRLAKVSPRVDLAAVLGGAGLAAGLFGWALAALALFLSTRPPASASLPPPTAPQSVVEQLEQPHAAPGTPQ